MQQAWATLSVREPVEALQGELDASVELQGKLRQQLVDAQANIAEYQEQGKADSQFAREQLQSERAREAVLREAIAGIAAVHSGVRLYAWPAEARNGTRCRTK